MTQLLIPHVRDLAILGCMVAAGAAIYFEDILRLLIDRDYELHEREDWKYRPPQ